MSNAQILGALLGMAFFVLGAWCRYLAVRLYKLEQRDLYNPVRVQAKMMNPNIWCFDTSKPLGDYLSWLHRKVAVLEHETGKDGWLARLADEMEEHKDCPEGDEDDCCVQHKRTCEKWPTTTVTEPPSRRKGDEKPVEDLYSAVYEAVLEGIMEKGSRGACTNDVVSATVEVTKMLRARGVS